MIYDGKNKSTSRVGSLNVQSILKLLCNPGPLWIPLLILLAQEILLVSSSETESNVGNGWAYQALLICSQEATPDCAPESTVRLVPSTASTMWHSQVSLSNRVINCKSNYLTIWNGITNRGRSNGRCFVLSQGNNKRWGVW